MANEKSPLKILGPEIIVLLAIFALILGVLNYFNILSLSSLYPNPFSSLPHRPFSAVRTNQTTVSKEPVTIGCPVEEKFCKNAQILYRPGTKAYQGLGWNLPTGSPLISVFDGELFKEDLTGTPSVRISTLKSYNNKYEGRYIFITDQKMTKGELKKYLGGVQVKKGDFIDKVSDRYLKLFGFPQSNFQFYIVDKTKNVTLRLKPEDLNNKKLSL